MPGRDFHSAARKAVFTAGALGILFVALAAAWLVARDYRDTLRDAELTLDQFAIVLAEHTRIALRDADATVLRSITIPPAHQGRDGAFAAEAVHRFFADLYAQLDLAYEGRVFVFRDDGTLMALVPPENGLVDQDFRNHPLFT